VYCDFAMYPGDVTWIYCVLCVCF